MCWIQLSDFIFHEFTFHLGKGPLLMVCQALLEVASAPQDIARIDPCFQPWL